MVLDAQDVEHEVQAVGVQGALPVQEAVDARFADPGPAMALLGQAVARPAEFHRPLGDDGARGAEGLNVLRRGGGGSDDRMRLLMIANDAFVARIVQAIRTRSRIPIRHNWPGSVSYA